MCSKHTIMDLIFGKYNVTDSDLPSRPIYQYRADIYSYTSFTPNLYVFILCPIMWPHVLITVVRGPEDVVAESVDRGRRLTFSWTSRTNSCAVINYTLVVCSLSLENGQHICRVRHAKLNQNLLHSSVDYLALYLLFVRRIWAQNSRSIQWMQCPAMH